MKKKTATATSTVLVSRKWHEPEITVHVSDKEIGVETKLDDFVAALADEVGNPTLYVTRAQMKRAIEEAAERVISAMKQETARVI